MPSDRPNGIGLGLGSRGDAPDLFRRYTCHPNCVLGGFGCNRDSVFSMTRESLFSEKQTVSYFFKDFFEFLSSLPFSFSDNLLSLDPFPWNVDAVTNYPHSSMAHMENLGNDAFLKQRVFFCIVFKATRTPPDESLILTVNEESQEPIIEQVDTRLTGDTSLRLSRLQSAFPTRSAPERETRNGGRQRYASSHFQSSLWLSCLLSQAIACLPFIIRQYLQRSNPLPSPHPSREVNLR